MKMIRFVSYLIYRYYSTGGTKDIPYASTLIALFMIICLHFFQITVLFDLINLMQVGSDNSRGRNFIIIALCSIPIFLLLSMLVKRSDLKKANYSPDEIKKGNVYLVIYLVVLVLSIPAITYLKKGHL